jgi:hypothetical protein
LHLGPVRRRSRHNLRRIHRRSDFGRRFQRHAEYRSDRRDFTSTFANGKLLGTSSGSGTASGHETATISIDLVITGGTGIFTGATGEGTLSETVARDSSTTESLAGSYTETLTFPMSLPPAALLWAPASAR